MALVSSEALTEVVQCAVDFALGPLEFLMADAPEPEAQGLNAQAGVEEQGHVVGAASVIIASSEFFGVGGGFPAMMVVNDWFRGVKTGPALGAESIDHFDVFGRKRGTDPQSRVKTTY